MKFVEVTELPESDPHKTGRRGYAVDELTAFLTMNVKMAKIVLDDAYRNSSCCYSAVHQLVKYHALPIDVKMRNGDVYLIRRDI